MFTVEQVRGSIPYVAHIVDTELVSNPVFRYQNVAFVGWLTQFDEAYTGIFQDFFHLFFMFIGNLDHDTRILGKENFYHIVFFHFV